MLWVIPFHGAVAVHFLVITNILCRTPVTKILWFIFEWLSTEIFLFWLHSHLKLPCKICWFQKLDGIAYSKELSAVGILLHSWEDT